MQGKIDKKPGIYYISFMPEQVTLNRLKLARVAAGLTQAELADQVGVTRQTIGLIEAGGYNPTINLCLRLAQATHKTLDELFWSPGEE